MRAIELACPTYAQQPNEICVDEYRLPLAYYHAKRVSDAAQITTVSNPVSREEFEKAVIDSDLI